MRIMSRLPWQQLMQNITLNNSEESSYKYTKIKVDQKTPGGQLFNRRLTLILG